MKIVTQMVSIDIDVNAQIDAVAQLDDYGVPGSPRWWDIQPKDYAGLKIEICGVEVLVKDLPTALSEAIFEAVSEAADEWKWEGYDE